MSGDKCLGSQLKVKFLRNMISEIISIMVKSAAELVLASKVNGPRSAMKLALDVEIGPRLGTGPRCESYMYIKSHNIKNVKQKLNHALLSSLSEVKFFSVKFKIKHVLVYFL